MKYLKILSILAFSTMTSVWADEDADTESSDESTTTASTVNTISAGTTIDSSNYDTYNNMGLDIAAAVTVNFGTSGTSEDDIKITIVDNGTYATGEEPKASLYMSVESETINVYDNVTVQQGSSTLSMYLNNKSKLYVRNGGYLTLEGDAFFDSYNNNAFFVIESGATLEVDTLTIEANLYMAGTILINEEFNVAKYNTSIGSTGAVSTGLTIYEGAEFVFAEGVDKVINFIGTDTDYSNFTSAYKTSNYIQIMDNDALSGITTVMTKGTSSTDCTVYMYYAFEKTYDLSKSEISTDKTAATGVINLGTLQVNDYNAIVLDLAVDNSSSTDGVFEGALFENIILGSDSTVAYSASTTTTSIILNGFANDLFMISAENKYIYMDEDGSYYIVLGTDDDTFFISFTTDYELADNEIYDFVGNALNAVTTAVPEPSTYAMIFGGIALGLAIYRRRK